jgi:hypothetical protein
LCSGGWVFVGISRYLHFFVHLPGSLRPFLWGAADQPAAELAADFTVFLPIAALGVIFLPRDEPGWRFALPRLQFRHGPLRTIILGLLHGLWHLPAFTPFLGPFTPSRFLAFIITAVFASFFYTWLFNNTGGSILIAMITHGASNAASQLMGMHPRHAAERLAAGSRARLAERDYSQ